MDRGRQQNNMHSLEYRFANCTQKYGLLHHKLVFAGLFDCFVANTHNLETCSIKCTHFLTIFMPSLQQSHHSEIAPLHNIVR